MPFKKELPATRLVDAIMDGGGPQSGVDDFLYLDPRIPRGQARGPNSKMTFTDAIVFMVGGGNYLEYENLREYARKSSVIRKKILYGTTELVTAKNFIAQLSELGTK